MRNIIITIIALCVLLYFLNCCKNKNTKYIVADRYLIYGTPLILNMYILIINEQVDDTFKPTLYVYENGETSIGNHFDLRDYLDLYNRTLTPLERVIRDKGAKVSSVLFERIYSFITDHFKVQSEKLYTLYKMKIYINNQLEIIDVNQNKQDPRNVLIPNLKTDLICLLENRCVDASNWVKLN
jgi:hypothetical protein